MEKKKTQVNVAIIGLNRYTASMGLALREYSQDPESHLQFKIVGQDADKQTRIVAQHYLAVDEIEGNARSAVRDANVVIVSLPTALLPDLYEYFAPSLKTGTVVLDMSMSKVMVSELAEKHFPRNPEGQMQAYLVGIHPLVNNTFLFDARMTVETADSKQFHGGEMVVAPDIHAPEAAVKLATDMADILGMTPHFMTPSEFDALAEYTEQMPLLLGFSLFAAMMASDGKWDLQRNINPTFAMLLNPLRHMEAVDLLTLWQQNSTGSQKRIDELIELLLQMRTLLENSNSKELETFVRETRGQLEQWLINRAKGKWEPSEQMSVPSGGFFSSMFGGFRGDKKKT